MDFIKNIAWWGWLLVAGLLGVVGYGVYYYIKNRPTDAANEADDANAAPDNRTDAEPSAGGGNGGSGGNGGNGSVTDAPVTDTADASQVDIPVGTPNLRLADIGLYKIRYTNPRQKSAQIQYLQSILCNKGYLARTKSGKQDGILGPATWAAVVKAYKSAGMTIGNKYNGNLNTVCGIIINKKAIRS